MYICICIYVYVYMYIYICTCICMYIYIHYHNSHPKLFNSSPHMFILTTPAPALDHVPPGTTAKPMPWPKSAPKPRNKTQEYEPSDSTHTASYLRAKPLARPPHNQLDPAGTTWNQLEPSWNHGGTSWNQDICKSLCIYQPSF